MSDPSTSLLNLNPFLVGLITLLFGLSTLVIPAIKSNQVKVLFTNPAFLIGDFILLPLATILMAYYQQNFLTTQALGEWIYILALSLVIATVAGVNFNLLKIWWLPHGIFYLYFVYLLMTFLFMSTQQIFQAYNTVESLIILITVCILVITHQILGLKFPKRIL